MSELAPGAVSAKFRVDSGLKEAPGRGVGGGVSVGVALGVGGAVTVGVGVVGGGVGA